MDTLSENLANTRIHLVGVKGTGMAALTEILHHQGAVITGSDVAETFYTDALLARLGIIPLLFSANNITAGINLVIYSVA
jgi:UDP-N-acetylmuramate--alanine ligase